MELKIKTIEESHGVFEYTLEYNGEQWFIIGRPDTQWSLAFIRPDGFEEYTGDAFTSLHDVLMAIKKYQA